MWKKTLIKSVVGLAALGLVGFLFVRSALKVGAEPYTISRSALAGWTVALDPGANASGVLLALWPPSTMAPPLFSQVFGRSGLTLSGPNPVSMPLLLQEEFDRAMAGRIAPDALVSLARDSGLESIQPKPLCMASRRVSQPGSTREVFFVRFELAPFEEFRRQVAERVGGRGFESGNLSPVVIVAATDSAFRGWLPLSGDGTQDCLAPMVTQ